MLVAAAFGLGAGGAQAASIEIKDAVARVTVVPQDRSDIKIEVSAPNPRLPLTVRSLGDRTILDGDLDRKVRECRGRGEASRVVVRGLGEIGWNEMPQVVIYTPRDVDLEAGGAVFGAVGRSNSLRLDNSGCGDWIIANVAQKAKVRQAGSGDTRMGSAGALEIRVAGSGDIAAADIRGGLEISIAGSGDAAVKSVNGPLELNVAGSGDVVVAGGRATTMKVSIAGSGDVDFRGSADTVHARIAGSGDVHVDEVKGEVSKMVMGSGSVRIGR
jgi:hypothetical protein